MFLSEVTMPIYSDIAQSGSLAESVTGLCGQNCSEIVTSRMNGIYGAGEKDACHASFTSRSNTLSCLNHSAIDI